MVGKRKAQELVDKGEISIGQLRSMIADKRGVGGMSHLNPVLTLEQTLDIFQGALAGRDDQEIPIMWKSDPYSRTSRMRRTRDNLLFTNIVRECG